MEQTKWKDKKIDVEKLNLDLQNPRIPKHVRDHNDAVEVLNYLLEKEGVMRIARSIANNGYHRSAVAIVCEEEGKLVVLDGNRRLAACKLLLEPTLAPDAKNRKELGLLNKKIDKKQFKEIKITIAPSRKEAEKEIWDIHVNKLLKPWEVLQQLRMYQSLINSGEYSLKEASKEYGVPLSDFTKSLGKLYFHEQILERLSDPKHEEELLKAGFNKIERLFLSKNGKKFLEYTFDDRGIVVPKNKKNFDRRLEELIPYVVTPNRVDAQAKQEDIQDSVFSVLDPKRFSKIKREALKDGSSKKKKVGKKVSGTVAKPDWITLAEYKVYSGSEKTKRMLKEMKDLKPVSYANILTVSLRVLLESALYHKLEELGHISKIVAEYKKSCKIKNRERIKKGLQPISSQINWSPSFREMLNYSLEESNGVIADPQMRDSLTKIVKGDVNFMEDLNSFIHNTHDLPRKDDPERIWSKFGRLLLGAISKMK